MKLFLKSLLKDIKDTLFDKDIIILLLIGPIFLTLFFGGVYVNDYLEDIPIAVLDNDNSQTSRMIVNSFDENTRFNIVKYPKSTKELKTLLDDRTIHMGLVIPNDFSKDITNIKAPEALILVDGSNMVIGNNAYAHATNIIQTVAAGTQIKILEAKGNLSDNAKALAMPFKFSDRLLYDPKMTYMNYLLLGFIGVFLQQVTLSGVGISVIKKGNELANKDSIKGIFSKIFACGFFSVLSTFISIFIANKLFKIPIRGDLKISLLMSILFVLAISAPAIIIASIVKDKVKYAQIAYMLSLPTFAGCGYIWTIDQLPKPLVIITKALWPLIYFLRDFVEVIFKGLPFEIVKTNLIQMGIYTVFWMVVAIFIFKKRFKVET